MSDPSTQRPSQPGRARIPVLTASALSVAIVAMWFAGMLGDTRKAQLRTVETWTYQLQNVAQSLDTLAASNSDMLVIDYAVDKGEGLQPLSHTQVDRLKRKPDGGRRLVIAYFSVGEAESYRPYWQASWTDNPPDWIIAENCRWPKNYLVSFWDKGWRDIVYAGRDSYLAAIQNAGFDGVYLDRVDVYADIEDRFPDARAKMLTFVEALAATARGRDKNFLIIVQNAEELLENRNYRDTIDSVAKEDLLFGVEGTDKRNAASMIAESDKMLALLKHDGKPVFAVEYVTSKATLGRAKADLARRGIAGVYPPRSLDGSAAFNSDAGAQAAPDKEADSEKSQEQQIGTPEFAKARCNGVWKIPAQAQSDTDTGPEVTPGSIKQADEAEKER